MHFFEPPRRQGRKGKNKKSSSSRSSRLRGENKRHLPFSPKAERTGLQGAFFYSHARNAGNVLTTEFECHLSIFLNHEVRDGHEEKQEEMPGTTSTDFYDLSAFFVLFVTFVVIPGLRQKLSARDNPDAFFILIPETIDSFWLLSLNGIRVFF